MITVAVKADNTILGVDDLETTNPVVDSITYIKDKNDVRLQNSAESELD